MIRAALTSIGLYKYQKLSMSVQNKSIVNNTLFKPKSRDDHLKQINETDQFDVLIIGGGATGVGTLLNCSRKGLKTLMVEKNDFGSATSTKSSKLLHGGLRYWQRVFNPFSKTRMEDLNLIQESLEERDIVLNCAPYITGEVGMVLPNKYFLVNLYEYIGVSMYHYYGKFRRSKFINDYHVQVQKPRLITKKDLKTLFPHINKKYNYGVVLYDGQFEESRLLMDSILTATAIKNEHMQPQSVLNYAELKKFIKDSSGKIVAAEIYDKVNQKTLQVKCKTVVNAAGVFADRIRNMANENLVDLMVPSKGDHLTFKAEGFVNSKSIGLFGADTDDGRVMYVLPWNNKVIVGTTEDKIDKLVSHPHVSETTVPQLMAELKKYFPDQNFELLSQWSGIRPLVKNPDLVSSKELSRKHVIEHDQQSGLISILGGKWTIFRKMGEEVTDKVVNVLKEQQQIQKEQSLVMLKKKTNRIKLLGDKNLKVFTDDQQYQNISKENMDVVYKEFNMIDQNVIDRLFKLYGLRALMILQDLSVNEDQRQQISDQNYITKGEIKHLIQSELVEYPVDLLTRRLRTAFEDSELSKQLLPFVVDIFGDLKNWDTEKRKLEYERNLHVLESMRFLQLILQYGSNKYQFQGVYELN